MPRLDDATLDAIRDLDPGTVGAVVGISFDRRRTALCPVHAERNPSFCWFRRAGGGIRYYCRSCQYSADAIGLVEDVAGLDFRAAVAALAAAGGLGDLGDAPIDRAALARRAETRAEAAAARDQAQQAADAANRRLAGQWWRQARPAGGTPVETYLRWRGIDPGALGGVPPTLRYLPDWPIDWGLRAAGADVGRVWIHPTARTFPVMIAPVQAVTGRLIAVHLTYLAPDGRGKAAAGRPKRVLGRIRGGSIRLGPLGPVLGQTEGIEDGLAVMADHAEAGRPLVVWPAISGGGLATAELPDAVETVRIFPDANGKTVDEDRDRVDAAVVRRHLEGRRVEVCWPERGLDWAAQRLARIGRTPDPPRAGAAA